MTAPGLPDPAFSRRRQPPFLDLTYAVLGWSHRAAQAVGSDRFAEIISRASFYFAQAAGHAHTPGEEALLAGLEVTLNELITANASARVVLADSVSGMNALEAWAFVELCETDEEPV